MSSTGIAEPATPCAAARHRRGLRASIRGQGAAPISSPQSISAALREVRLLAFAPPVVLLIGALVLSLADYDAFLQSTSAANAFILSRLDWLFSIAAFAAVLLLAGVALSPLGRVRIGGADARPIVSRWSWFAITLCTTIAIGILFWAAAEPLLHVGDPPDFAGAAPQSEDARRFAVSMLYMHWTVTPYALYCVPALAFALAHFNRGAPYSLAGPLATLFGRRDLGRAGAALDAVGLYALVAGVAASLGVGVMTVAGGLERVFGISDGAATRACVTLAIVAAFVASSISGIQRGIRALSDANVKIFIALTIFVLIAGPTLDILRLAGAGLIDYVAVFAPHSLSLGARAGDPWMRDWTVFYFANWLAWAPITALFLGRISVGYTVREFLLVNMIAPASFGALWMGVFGGAALLLDARGGALGAALADGGENAAIYALFDALPFAALAVPFFLAATFISFVTAMDSNTHSIAAVCLNSERAGDADQGRARMTLKLFWGALVGAVAWVMTASSGIDGVRMLSNLGGAPGLFILIAMGAALIRMTLMGPKALSRGAPGDRDPS